MNLATQVCLRENIQIAHLRSPLFLFYVVSRRVCEHLTVTMVSLKPSGFIVMDLSNWVSQNTLECFVKNTEEVCQRRKTEVCQSNLLVIMKN